MAELFAHNTSSPYIRLGRREGAELIRRVAGRKSLPEDVENEILSRTDGVPLFVEELTKAVIESGALRELHDRYVIDEPLPSLAIPSTLQASLVARLDRLAPVREIAQIGAVIGRDFTYELLSVVAGLSSDRLNDSLAQLVRAELLFARGEPPQSTYTFKHSLVRDTAYTSLLKSRRIQIYGKIAKTLESQFPDFAQSQPELLAHHLTEGGLYRKSLSYWLRAGRNAAQRSAHIEASAHLYKGLDVAYRLPEDTERTAVELNFHFELGPCLIATKGPASSEAMATFTKARRLCEQLGDPPEYLQILFWQTTASVIRGELVRANESIDALLSLAKVRRDVPALLNATRGQAMILLFMGRFTEAREALNQAVDIFHSSDESDQLAARAAGQDALVADLALLSWTLWIMGHIDQAVESIDAAIGRAETLDHPHTKAYAYYYSSVLHALRDENDIALDYAERCLNLSERHAFRQWHGLSTAVKGICIARIDNSMAALVPVTTALDDYHRSGYQLGITALLVLMCRALLVNEQPERAIEVAERGLIIVDQNSERVLPGGTTSAKGTCVMDEARFQRWYGSRSMQRYDLTGTSFSYCRTRTSPNASA